jgi:transcriptional regulator with XRE-family HTH domain
MLDLKEIQERLSDRNLSEVARRVGISRQYLTDVASGKAANPGWRVLSKLSDYLEGKVLEA